MHCTCASEGAGFQSTGRITELSDSVLSITGMACEALIPLDGVSYHYHGSQDIPSAMKKSLEGTLVSVLELRLRSGDTVVMAEVRTASSPAGTATVGGTRGGARAGAGVAGRWRRRVAWYGTSWEGD